MEQPLPQGATERQLPPMTFGKLDDMRSRVAVAIDAIRKYGTGTGGVRLLTGTIDIHHEMEREVAALRSAAGRAPDDGTVR